METEFAKSNKID